MRLRLRLLVESYKLIAVGYKLLIVSCLLLIVSRSLSAVAWADYYAPSDSVPLTIGTVSIGSDSVQDCDSVRIKWWWLDGGWTYVGTKKLTSSVESGFYSTNIKASDASNHTGNYIAKAVAYKFDGSYTDIKTWSWTVVETFDSLTNAITNTNKANFKADISGLSTFDPTSDSVMTANPPAYQSSGDTNTFDIVNQLANRPAIGDTNTNPFQAGIDDVILASNLEDIAHRNYDTMYVHRDDFKADVTVIEQFIEPQTNRKNIFVSTSGSDDNSGLSWNGAVATLRIAETKCSGADEYFVYVSPGTYSSTSCTTDIANVHWIGSGRERTFLVGTSGKPVMRIEADGIEITGFELAGGNDAIWINNSSHFNIHDNRIKNNTTHMGDGILAFGSSHYGRIHDNYFHTQWGFCISLQGDYNLIYNNIIDSLRTASGTRAIILSATAKWNTIHNNRIHVEGSSYGIEVADGSGDNFIVDNYVYSGTAGQEYKELYSNATAYVANHGRSGRWEEDTTSTIEEDIHSSVDSVNNAIHDANKANFKADISDLLSRGDSSLYMRTDWNNIKNQDAEVNFSHTRMAFVDSVDSITQTLSASCDTESIARSTWNDDIIPQAERRIGYVDSLGEEISASVDTSQIKAMNDNNQWGASFIWNYSVRTLTSGTGSGANSVVVRCKSFSDSSAIAFAQIQVLDSTENSTIGLLTSDSQGRGFFALDNGVYCVRLYKPGWQFTVPETLKVDKNEDTSYYAEAFDPGSPPQADLCRVHGWIYDINDQPMVGTKIEAQIKTVPLRYQNLVISPYYKSAVTDDEGYWFLDLYPNFILSPSDTKYIFHIFSPSGTILRLQTEVPDQASWELQW